MEKLENWKNKTNRRPLVLYGVRQVGKTWLVKEFGKEYFKQTAYINFENNNNAKRIFDQDYDVFRIMKALSIEADVNITPNDTLIIFDEAQECPRAITSLKYFNENAPEFHIIAAGSLLGVMSPEGTGFPAGNVDMLTLYPMTFLEFLEAVDNRYVNIIKNFDFPLLHTFHASIMDLLKQYFYTGGMPAAVKCYAQTKDFSDTRDIQNLILNAYYADFAKHIPSTATAKVRAIWNSVPVQLSKDNRRFLYSDIKKGSRGRDYEIAMQWLKNTGLVHALNRVSSPKMPLIAYNEAHIFKLYMADIGLLSARTALSPKAYIDEHNNPFNHYKGVLAEQFVLQELLAADNTLPVYYWEAEKNNAEVEFVIQYENDIIPMEVKAGKKGKSESLKAYKFYFAPEITVSGSQNEYRRSGSNFEVPLYLAGDFGGILFVI
jgi:predicted AAA+ superfamily ATPase